MYPRIARLRTLLLVVVFSAILPAHAANVFWTNTSGGVWSAATNWSPNIVPTASDNAFITNSGIYTVAIDVNVTLAGLRVGGGSGTQVLVNSSQNLVINGLGLF